MSGTEHSPTSTAPSARLADIEILLDGQRSLLAEYADGHAVVYSPVSVKVEQRVRILLRRQGEVVRTHARVESAWFEMPKDGPRYKVALSFDGDLSQVTRICAVGD